MDQARFREVLRAQLGRARHISRRLFFQAVHVAYAAALGRRVALDPIINFGMHVTSRKKTLELLADFPRACFLQTLRDPVRGLGSMFRHHDDVGEGHVWLGTYVIGCATDKVGPTPPSTRSRWFAVRLEDLHREPRGTMERLARRLGLVFDDGLLRSTVNGKLWWNERNTIQVSGFDRAIVEQRFESYISPFDDWRLRSLLRPYCRLWRYPTPSGVLGLLTWLLGPLLLLWPLTMERRAWATGRIFGAAPTRHRVWRVILWAYVYARLRLLRLWPLALRNGRTTEVIPV